MPHLMSQACFFEMNQQQPSNMLEELSISFQRRGESVTFCLAIGIFAGYFVASHLFPPANADGFLFLSLS
jgi:hypothetical protein